MRNISAGSKQANYQQAQNPARSRQQEADNKLIIFSAPSGAGKTTIVRHLLSKPYNLEFSVSATSRSPRSYEKDGFDYHFISKEEFLQKIEEKDFLEWEEVYSGVYYGTLKNEVEKILINGKNVIFDVDVKGGLHIKDFYKDRALAVFVSPPSIEALKNRLQERFTETTEKIAIRIAKAEYEMSFAPRFDVILVNDKLEEALKEAERITEEFLNIKNNSL